MFNLGLFELTLFGIIALIVIGPEKLPEVARTLGRWYGLFRRASARVQNELLSELNIAETQALLKTEIEKIRESEAQMKAQMQALQSTLAKTQHHVNENKNAILESWQSSNTTDGEVSTNSQRDVGDVSARHSSDGMTTNAMYYHWFKLSDYDKNRRLPAAPRLPNYTADPYLFQMPAVTSSNSQSKD